MFLSSFFGYALGGEIFRVFVGAMKIARNVAVFER